MESKKKEPIFKQIIDELIRGDSKDPEKTKKAFQEAVMYFEGLNQILKTGTDEQKKKAMQEFMQLKKQMDKGIERMHEESGMSKEEILKQARDPANYSQEDWNVINESLEDLQSIKELPDNLEKNRPPPTKSKGRKKKPHEKWTKS